MRRGIEIGEAMNKPGFTPVAFVFSLMPTRECAGEYREPQEPGEEAHILAETAFLNDAVDQLVFIERTEIHY